jgi:serine/threonine-protein kinase
MLNTGDILQQGKYRIIKSLGGGGMGRVYQAEHTMLKTTVAIKELIDQFSTPQERQEGIALFLKEAQRLTVLDHPMVVKVSDFFIDGNNYYLVMEYHDIVVLPY